MSITGKQLSKLMSINDKQMSTCVCMCLNNCVLYEEFEDTKEVIRIRISKNKQHNGQMKKDKRTNNDLQNKHTKLMSE